MLVAALRYASLGWPVLPIYAPGSGESRCTCPNPGCRTPGKHPMNTNGVSGASRVEGQIRAWWTVWPDANIAVATGAGSGLVVLDVDPAKGGDTSLEQWEAASGALPDTVLALTGGGGRHFCFQHPGAGTRVRNKVALAPGLDIRGDEGYIVVAPSRHVSGRYYQWEASGHPLDVALAPLPDALRRMLLEPARPTAAPPVDEAIPEGQRNAVLVSLGGSMRRRGMAEAEILAALLAVNANRCRPPLDEAEVAAVAQSVARYAAGPPPPAPPPGAVPRVGRPTIYIPGSQAIGGAWVKVGHDRFVREVLDTLPDGTLYRMDTVVGVLDGPDGAKRFIPLESAGLRPVVDAHAELARTAKDGKAYVEKYVPCGSDLALVVLAEAERSARVRDLQMLVRYPVYLADWTRARPGWNAEAGIYYDEPAALHGLAPQATGGLEVLHDLVADFPFADLASAENVFGLLLTPLIRFAIGGTVPFHLVMAPLERTGKGKLIEAALGQAVLGDSVPVVQPGSTEEEKEKRITSLILKGATAVHLDNLPTETVLDSPALASLATSPVWMGRMLGRSLMPALKNYLTVVMSGNNPKATGELVKRTVPIALHPKTPRPEDRADFLHPDAEGYAREARPRVLAALLGLIDGWVQAGRPEAPTKPRLGGFERWARTVGGILARAGATAWLTNYREWTQAADDRSADYEALVEAWWEKWRLTNVAAKDLLSLASGAGLFPEMFALRDDGRLVWFAKKVLGAIVNRPFQGGLRPMRAGSGAHSRYFLSRFGAEEITQEAGPGVIGQETRETREVEH